MKEQNVYDIPFREFKGINVNKMLKILNETYNENISVQQQLKKYFNSRWYDRYEYKYKRSDGNKFIAFYSDFYFRKDHFLIFSRFVKEFPDFDYVIPIKLSKERRNFFRGIKMMKWDIYNLCILRRINIQFKEKIYWIRVLGLIYLYYTKMEKYLMAKPYTYGLVYNDSNPYENILVQLMKQRGMRTATLQHGIFDKHGYWKGLEFRTSVADDWLAWNPYTKELAVECGILAEKIKVLGIPRYIKPIMIEKKNQLGFFSIILGGKVLFEENVKLLNFANILAKEQGLKYLVRFHPTSKDSEYDTFINEKYYIRKSSQEESIANMCQQSDFSLVGSGTSMIIDLIYLKQPFFQYYEEWNGEKYRERENYFRNYEELKEQVKKGIGLQSEEVFHYYCTTKEVKSSYEEYFASL